MSGVKYNDWEDTKLVECAICHTALNGKSLWIVGDFEPVVLCEDCYPNRAKLLLKANKEALKYDID